MSEQFKLNSRWKTPEETRDFWNLRAKSYNEQNDLSVDYKTALINYYVDKGALNKDSVVLDLGCGPGNYTRLIAPHVKEVIGVDISDEMLKYAGENNREFANASFKNVDWWTADIEKIGFKKKFDFVFANMTPSIRDEETFMKMIECSRHYCHYAIFVYRTSSLGETFGKHTEFKGNSKEILDRLWELEMYPEISYRVGSSIREFTPEEALELVNRDFDGGISGEPKELFKDFIKDGKVQDSFKFRSAVMFWSVVGD